MKRIGQVDLKFSEVSTGWLWQCENCGHLTSITFHPNPAFPPVCHCSIPEKPTSKRALAKRVEELERRYPTLLECCISFAEHTGGHPGDCPNNHE